MYSEENRREADVHENRREADAHSFAVEFRNGDHAEGADVASLLNLEGAEMQAYKIAIRQLSGLARESFFDERCGSNVWSQI